MSLLEKKLSVRRRKSPLRKQTVPTKPETKAGGSAEDALRRHLVNKDVMSDTDDDIALRNWLDSMRLPTEDARNAWERGVQNRLERELGMA